MNYKDTIEKAKQARKLFRSGKNNKEVQDELSITKATYYRYWKILGGITNEDRIENLKNKE